MFPHLPFKGQVFGRMPDDEFQRYRYYPLKCLLYATAVAVALGCFVAKVVCR